MPSRAEIVHDILSITNWCEDQAASSALEDLAAQIENMRCENCDSNGELLKEMAEALQGMADIYYGRDNQPIAGAYARKMDIVLQKYHEQED